MQQRALCQRYDRATYAERVVMGAIGAWMLAGAKRRRAEPR